jgi:tRNA A37 threonylcarbamoyladenosine synthetase subunit TsaC/SUA5/YrdC
MKKRSLEKPLAVLVDNFKWLKDNTNLNSKQIDFLKNYDRPFTILTNSDHLRLWINYIDEDNNEFINKDIYKKFAFRVANNDVEKKLIKQN